MFFNNNLTFLNSRNLNARHSIKSFIHCANHSAILTVSDKASITDANAFRAVSIFRAVATLGLVIARRRRILSNDSLAVKAVAFIARQTFAIVAAVAVVAFSELGADVRAAALVNVDTDLGRFTIGTGGGKCETVLTLALNGRRELKLITKIER